MINWKDGFKIAMVDATLANGSPLNMKGNGNYYGWLDPNWDEVSEAIRNGTIDYGQCSYVEAEWQEFGGTFYEGDETEHGIDATIVLTDGRQFVYRWKGHMSDVIQAVIGD